MRSLLATGMAGLAGAVLVAGALAPTSAHAQKTAFAPAPDAVSATLAATPAVPCAPGPVSITIGPAVQPSLVRGCMQVYTLDLPAGQVVQGFFESASVTLDLQDAQGRHLRRLGRASGAAEPFMWITRGAGQERLVATARTDAKVAGNYTLALTKALAQVPAEHGVNTAQVAPALPSPQLQALQQTLAQGGTSDAFWRERARIGTPMVEPLSPSHSLVTFLWRGANQTSVRLFGSPSGNHDPLQRLGTSDVWWASFEMPNTARLSYRLAPDVPRVQGSAMEQRRAILATAQRDPLNAAFFPVPDGAAAAMDVFQGSSVLALPAAPPQPWITARPGVVRGVLEQHRLASTVLGNERAVWIYRPAGAVPQALLVLFDAHAYRADVPTPAILDNLLADGLIPPTALVLVGNASPEARGTELPPNPAFARFLDEELMPWVQRQGLAQPAARTVIAGSSYGGLASAYAGLMHPEWFGNVLSLSGSYWWAPGGHMPGWIMRTYAAEPLQPDHPVRFYLDAGRYEAARGGQDGILETNRHLGDVLRAKGYAVTQVEHDTGHDYLHWQGALGCGLVALLQSSRFAQKLPVCAG